MRPSLALIPHRLRRFTAAGALAGALLGGRPAAAAVTLVPEPIPHVPVLLLHQVSDEPIRSAHGEDNTKEPWTSPAAFDALLTRLEGEGYRFVTMRAARAFLAGSPAPLPAKPLLLTFDDGYASAWTVATPILRKHHVAATMFFEGQLTGVKAGRLTVPQLRAMRASGVWTLESHGWIGHGNITVDAAGTREPYWYANLMWRPDRGRHETVAEFQARIRGDLQRFRATFEPKLGVPIDVFAYPSGEFGQNAPLPAGGRRRARLEAGHSNAAGLTPYLIAGLREAGIRTAFAVSVPGVTSAASQASDDFAIPRLGIGATFDTASLTALETRGFEVPEVTADARFTDCRALADDGTRVWTASSSEPLLFALNENGRPLATIPVPGLDADRGANPSLISGIDVRGDTLTVVQKSGWWPGAQPEMTTLRIAGNTATVLERRLLPPALNWTVGLARMGDTLLALTDDGTVRDLGTGAVRFAVVLKPGEKRAQRFAGLAAWGDRFLTYDATTHAVLALDGRGTVLATMPIAGDVRRLAVTGDRLSILNGANARTVVERYRLVGRP